MTETINNETKICDIKFKYLVADEYISSENRDEYFGAKMTDFLANKQFAEMGIFGTENGLPKMRATPKKTNALRIKRIGIVRTQLGKLKRNFWKRY